MAVLKMVDIVAKCSTTLQDVANARWTQVELLGWGNDAQREIVKYRPDASVAHRKIQLVAGTVQAIPAGDLSLIRFLRNMGLDGNTPGRAIRDMDRDDLDRQNPNWHTDVASAVVQRGVFDEEDPKVFYVTPPQPGAGQGYIEIIDSVPPADATIIGVGGAGASSVISIDDTYANDIYNYIMASALSKEAEFANPAAGAGYRQLFTQSLSGKTQADAASSPAKAQEGAK